jgi:serine protease Do
MLPANIASVASVKPASTSTGQSAATNQSSSTAANQSQSASVAAIASQANGVGNNGITQVFKQVEPDVMGVVNYGQVANYFSQSSQLKPVGVGTGVLFYKDSQYGYVVTNNHVVEGSAKVEAVLVFGKHVKADVVGTDPYTDLAVIKIPVSAVQNVTPVTFADSDNIETGETAIAIGTPMGLSFADTVTAGIVSAKSRIMPVEGLSS